MSPTLLHALIVIAASGAAFILGAALLRTGWWAVANAVAGTLTGLRYSAWFLWHSAQQMASFLQRCIAFVAVSCWLIVCRSVRFLGAAAGRKAGPFFQGLHARLFAWQAGLRDTASSGPDDEHDDSRGNDRHGPRPAFGDAYADALATLGLEDVHPLTAEILRARYREMIQRVHPDKGFPSKAFSQLLNAANNVIKQAHGWR